MIFLIWVSWMGYEVIFVGSFCIRGMMYVFGICCDILLVFFLLLRLLCFRMLKIKYDGCSNLYELCVF